MTNNNSSFAKWHPKHRETGKSSKTEALPEQHHGWKCDVSFDFTTRPQQKSRKGDAATQNSTVGEWRPSVCSQTYSGQTYVAPSQKSTVGKSSV